MPVPVVHVPARSNGDGRSVDKKFLEDVLAGLWLDVNHAILE
jgi:hypothetical protein